MPSPSEPQSKRQTATILSRSIYTRKRVFRARHVSFIRPARWVGSITQKGSSGLCETSSGSIARRPNFTMLWSGSMDGAPKTARSEEHTSELQSLMRISYAVFCLHKKKKQNIVHNTNTYIRKHDVTKRATNTNIY